MMSASVCSLRLSRLPNVCRQHFHFSIFHSFVLTLLLGNGYVVVIRMISVDKSEKKVFLPENNVSQSMLCLGILSL